MKRRTLRLWGRGAKTGDASTVPAGCGCAGMGYVSGRVVQMSAFRRARVLVVEVGPARTKAMLLEDLVDMTSGHAKRCGDVRDAALV